MRRALSRFCTRAPRYMPSRPPRPKSAPSHQSGASLGSPSSGSATVKKPTATTEVSQLPVRVAPAMVCTGRSKNGDQKRSDDDPAPHAIGAADDPDDRGEREDPDAGNAVALARELVFEAAQTEVQRAHATGARPARRRGRGRVQHLADETAGHERQHARDEELEVARVGQVVDAPQRAQHHAGRGADEDQQRQRPEHPALANEPIHRRWNANDVEEVIGGGDCRADKVQHAHLKGQQPEGARDAGRRGEAGDAQSGEKRPERVDPHAGHRKEHAP